MGKGKGKYKSWTLRIRGNTTFVEVERIKRGRFLYMARQIRARTTPLLSIIHRTSIRSPLPILHTAARLRL
uniref:Ribosomal protein L16 n=1 Tax=Urostyla grandis TaxID=57509 RepID=A0A2I4PEP5_9SPIT|nr:ribosomal protein L16 [Urostyla grandis]